MASNDLTIITLNVQGLRNHTHRTTLFSWLNCVKADIICLQETHSSSCDESISGIQSESYSGNNTVVCGSFLSRLYRRANPNNKDRLER